MTTQPPMQFVDAEDQLKQVTDLIKQNRHDEARELLMQIDHPKAKEWLAKYYRTGAGAEVSQATSGLRFRKNLFLVLAVLALLWVCGGSALFSSAASDVAQTPAPTIQGLSQQEANSYRGLGAAIGGGLGITFFACTGLPLALLFGLLAWRNSAGITNERRHREALAIQDKQFQALQQTAMASSAQAAIGLAGLQQTVPTQPSLPSGDVALKAKFDTARELIQDKEYDAARAILRKIDHPTAREWLEKLDRQAPKS
jgi:hypothetical protein